MIYNSSTPIFTFHFNTGTLKGFSNSTAEEVYIFLLTAVIYVFPLLGTLWKSYNFSFAIEANGKNHIKSGRWTRAFKIAPVMHWNEHSWPRYICLKLDKYPEYFFIFLIMNVCYWTTVPSIFLKRTSLKPVGQWWTGLHPHFGDFGDFVCRILWNFVDGGAKQNRETGNIMSKIKHAQYRRLV